jgi:hypothetical protein
MSLTEPTGQPSHNEGTLDSLPESASARSAQYSDGISDLCDRAHQRVVEKLVEGGTVCKVRIEDVFDALESHDRTGLLVRLAGLGFLAGEHKRDATEQLIQDAGQIVHDFVENNDFLRDAELDAMEAESDREGNEEYYR